MQAAPYKTPQQKNTEAERLKMNALVAQVELEPGAEAFGAPSDSRAWMHECEVRMLSLAEVKMTASFYTGAAAKRGQETINALKEAVTERKSAMMKLGLNHPRINMDLYLGKNLREEVSPEPEPEVMQRRGLF